MRKNVYCIICLCLFLLLSGRFGYAVLDRYNVGVGYSASNELAISTDTPGEFDYSLYLRAADNNSKTVSVHYTGISNLYRTITLSCGSGESNVTDNPQTGTCMSGGPFVRGAFVAGNNNQYAVVKRFTLFCGSVQIVGEQTTNNWSSGDFYNDAIKDFLDNGASSTWCPSTSISSTTPTITPTKKPSPTSRVIKKRVATSTPVPTAAIKQEQMIVDTPTPTRATARTPLVNKPPDNSTILWVTIVSVVATSAVVVVAYVKFFGTKKSPIPLDEHLNSDLQPEQSVEESASQLKSDKPQ